MLDATDLARLRALCAGAHPDRVEGDRASVGATWARLRRRGLATLDGDRVVPTEAGRALAARDGMPAGQLELLGDE